MFICTKQKTTSLFLFVTSFYYVSAVNRLDCTLYLFGATSSCINIIIKKKKCDDFIEILTQAMGKAYTKEKIFQLNQFCIVYYIKIY